MVGTIKDCSLGTGYTLGTMIIISCIAVVVMVTFVCNVMYSLVPRLSRLGGGESKESGKDCMH